MAEMTELPGAGGPRSTVRAGGSTAGAAARSARSAGSAPKSAAKTVTVEQAAAGAAGLAGIQPVKREPAALAITAQLTEAIMDGRLPQGTQLGEADLAARLGVSRGPLREALQRLVQQGIAHSEPHRGVFVTTLTEDDVRDIYLLRTALESAACQIIVRSHPRRAAARLAKSQRAMAAAAKRGDLAGVSRADLELHQVLVEESGSVRLRRMAETLLVETRMCMSALADKYPTPVEMVDEHAALIAALRAGDEERLLRLLAEHMADAVLRLTRGAGAGDVLSGAAT